MTDLLIETDGPVLTLTWNRPDSLNALTAAMVDGAAQAITDADEAVRLVVLTGRGRAFCSGAEVGASQGGTETLEAIERLVRAITTTPRPVLVAAQGLAAGVGASIAAAGDVTVMREDAYFLLAFVNIGLMPDGGATELFAASVGRARASAMALLGERLPAPEAERAGLIHRAVPAEAWDAEVAALVEKLSTGPTRSYAATKAAMLRTTLPHLDTALAAEMEGQVTLFDTDDFAEGVDAFRGKRPARFSGR